MVYGVTGASGKLGRLVTQELLSSVPPESLVLTTRQPQALAAEAAAGVQVRQGDFDDPTTLTAAFEGVDRLLVISASNATGVREVQHRTAMEAARDAGVGHVIFTSMPRVDEPDHPIQFVAREYRKGEEDAEELFDHWTILRVYPFTELQIVERLPILFGDGKIVTNARDGKRRYISRTDVARTAAAVLRDADKYDHQLCDVAGPNAYSFKEVAALISELSGQEIEYVEVDDGEYRKLVEASGQSQLMVDALVGAGIAMREGYMEVPSDFVERSTGTAPRDLPEVLAEHV